MLSCRDHPSRQSNSTMGNPLPKLLLLCCIIISTFSGIRAEPTEKNGSEILLLGGDYPDPSILRDGDTYYMVHSSFEYLPGLLIFESKNLIDWTPVTNALHEYVGSVYAPDIVKHGDRWYIYFPAVSPERITNMVVWADTPQGPWSDPIDLKIGGIDPGHAVDQNGNRFLMMDNGMLVPLAADGLSIAGPAKKVYEGWTYPEEWDVEGFCLEGPKIKKIGKYYYMLSAEGGTAGPPTSHMVVVARSENLSGPWENSPYNPLIHTYNNNERWCSKGHGTLIDTPEGDWYVVYHAYERGYYTLGRQTLIEPVEMNAEGWFVPATKGKIDKKPNGVQRDFSDNFSANRIGTQWRFHGEYTPSDFRYEPQTLVLRARGNSPADATSLLFQTGDHAYEMEVEAMCGDSTSAGLILFYNPDLYAGVGVQQNEIVFHLLGRSQTFGIPATSRHLWFRLRNDRHIVSAWYSFDGKQWTKIPKACEASGYHHNMAEGFLSLQPGIYAAGKGEVSFRNFKYKRLE